MGGDPIRSDWQVLKWILLEADMWVDPPLVEQIFIIESSRWENFENLFLNRLLVGHLPQPSTII